MKGTIVFGLMILVILGWLAFKGVGSYGDAIKYNKSAESGQEGISLQDKEPQSRGENASDEIVSPSSGQAQTNNPLASMINDAFRDGRQNTTTIQVCSHDGKLQPSLDGKSCTQGDK